MTDTDSTDTTSDDSMDFSPSGGTVGSNARAGFMNGEFVSLLEGLEDPKDRQILATAAQRLRDPVQLRMLAMRLEEKEHSAHHGTHDPAFMIPGTIIEDKLHIAPMVPKHGDLNNDGDIDDPGEREAAAREDGLFEYEPPSIEPIKPYEAPTSGPAEKGISASEIIAGVGLFALATGVAAKAEAAIAGPKAPEPKLPSLKAPAPPMPRGMKE
jgi:hypothetical protein